MWRMVGRKSGSLRKAEKDGSVVTASFQGFRPVMRLTRMTPRAQMSFGAEA
jgi:hypothetical protein